MTNKYCTKTTTGQLQFSSMGNNQDFDITGTSFIFFALLTVSPAWPICEVKLHEKQEINDRANIFWPFFHFHRNKVEGTSEYHVRPFFLKYTSTLTSFKLILFYGLVYISWSATERRVLIIPTATYYSKEHGIERIFVLFGLFYAYFSETYKYLHIIPFFFRRRSHEVLLNGQKSNVKDLLLVLPLIYKYHDERNLISWFFFLPCYYYLETDDLLIKQYFPFYGIQSRKTKYIERNILYPLIRVRKNIPNDDLPEDKRELHFTVHVATPFFKFTTRRSEELGGSKHSLRLLPFFWIRKYPKYSSGYFLFFYFKKLTVVENNGNENMRRELPWDYYGIFPFVQFSSREKGTWSFVFLLGLFWVKSVFKRYFFVSLLGCTVYIDREKMKLYLYFPLFVLAMRLRNENKKRFFALYCLNTWLYLNGDDYSLVCFPFCVAFRRKDVLFILSLICFVHNQYKNCTENDQQKRFAFSRNVLCMGIYYLSNEDQLIVAVIWLISGLYRLKQNFVGKRNSQELKLDIHEKVKLFTHVYHVFCLGLINIKLRTKGTEGEVLCERFIIFPAVWVQDSHDESSQKLIVILPFFILRKYEKTVNGIIIPIMLVYHEDETNKILLVFPWVYLKYDKDKKILVDTFILLVYVLIKRDDYEFRSYPLFLFLKYDNSVNREHVVVAFFGFVIITNQYNEDGSKDLKIVRVGLGLLLYYSHQYGPHYFTRLWVFPCIFNWQYRDEERILIILPCIFYRKRYSDDSIGKHSMMIILPILYLKIKDNERRKYAMICVLLVFFYRFFAEKVQVKGQGEKVYNPATKRVFAYLFLLAFYKEDRGMKKLYLITIVILSLIQYEVNTYPTSYYRQYWEKDSNVERNADGTIHEVQKSKNKQIRYGYTTISFFPLFIYERKDVDLSFSAYNGEYKRVKDFTNINLTILYFVQGFGLIYLRAYDNIITVCVNTMIYLSAKIQLGQVVNTNISFLYFLTPKLSLVYYEKDLEKEFVQFYILFFLYYKHSLRQNIDAVSIAIGLKQKVISLSIFYIIPEVFSLISFQMEEGSTVEEYRKYKENEISKSANSLFVQQPTIVKFSWLPFVLYEKKVSIVDEFSETQVSIGVLFKWYLSLFNFMKRRKYEYHNKSDHWGNLNLDIRIKHSQNEENERVLNVDSPNRNLYTLRRCFCFPLFFFRKRSLENEETKVNKFKTLFKMVFFPSFRGMDIALLCYRNYFKMLKGVVIEGKDDSDKRTKFFIFPIISYENDFRGILEIKMMYLVWKIALLYYHTEKYTNPAEDFSTFWFTYFFYVHRSQYSRRAFLMPLVYYHWKSTPGQNDVRNTTLAFIWFFYKGISIIYSKKKREMNKSKDVFYVFPIAHYTKLREIDKQITDIQKLSIFYILRRVGILRLLFRKHSRTIDMNINDAFDKFTCFVWPLFYYEKFFQEERHEERGKIGGSRIGNTNGLPLKSYVFALIWVLKLRLSLFYLLVQYNYARKIIHRFQIWAAFILHWDKFSYKNYLSIAYFPHPKITLFRFYLREYRFFCFLFILFFWDYDRRNFDPDNKYLIDGERDLRFKTKSIFWFFHKNVSFIYWFTRKSDEQAKKLIVFWIFGFYAWLMDEFKRKNKFSVLYLFNRRITFFRYSLSYPENVKLRKFVIFPFFRFDRKSGDYSKWCVIPFIAIKYSYQACILSYVKTVIERGDFDENGNENKQNRKQIKKVRFLYKFGKYSEKYRRESGFTKKTLELNPFYYYEKNEDKVFWNLFGGLFGKRRLVHDEKSSCRCCCFFYV